MIKNPRFGVWDYDSSGEYFPMYDKGGIVSHSMASGNKEDECPKCKNASLIDIDGIHWRCLSCKAHGKFDDLMGMKIRKHKVLSGGDLK